jgi:hypothetical protein
MAEAMPFQKRPMPICMTHYTRAFPALAGFARPTLAAQKQRG